MSWRDWVARQTWGLFALKQGLISSISRRAPTGLDRAEPWVSRLVPVLVVIFLSIAGSAGLYHLTSAREEALVDKMNDLTLISAAVQSTVEHLSRGNGSIVPNEMELNSRIPAMATAAGRFYAIIDEAGKVLYTAPPLGARPSNVADVLAVPVRQMAANSTFRTRLTTGQETIVALRPVALAAGTISAMVVAIHPIDQALAPWFGRTQAFVTLVLTLAGVVAALGAAFYMQSARAQAADNACSQMTDRIDAALSEVRCGLWEWDIANGRFFWSNSMFELLGKTSSETLLGFGEIAEFMHPDDESLFTIAQRMIEDEAYTVEHDFRMKHSNGHWIWLRARMQMVADAPNHPRLIGVINDVSEHKRLEEFSTKATAARVEADRRLADAVNSISEAFVLWDSAHRLVLCNSKFRDFYSIDADKDIRGMAYADLIPQPQTLEEIDHRSSDTRPGSHAYEVLTQNGRWLQISERPTSDGGFVSIGTDISTHKAQEARLIASERELLQTVSDLRKSRQALQVKTVELAELADNYRDQRMVAEAANRSKTEFLSNMGHELRTPLNAIIGFSEIMEQRLFGALGSDRYDEYVRNIHDSGRGLLAIINDVLEMSRIEAGKVALQPDTVGVHALVDACIGSVRADAASKSISLFCRAPSDVRICADERLVRQALVQLLRNAIKFTPVGGCASVRVRAIDTGVKIFIEDTGVGILPEDISRYGRPFELLGKELCNGNRGSGLGAAIAKSLVELHGGSLRVRSRKGYGTIVMVSLPTIPAVALH